MRHGLPTPICNPGLKSLEAAAHPANVNYLYYVAKPDGSHYFTDNYQDFLNHGGERRIGGGTRLAGVIGWPVEHTRSPQMHNGRAALGMDWAYVAMPVEPARLEQALRGAAALGSRG